MDEVILHHYALSPFAEKVRRILAYKQIPWRAVEQPMMAPKPDLTALTGGYRRIPVMQSARSDKRISHGGTEIRRTHG